MSAFLGRLTWTTLGQTPLGRKSDFSQHWFLCAGFLFVKDISLSMDCYAAMGPSVLQSSVCHAYIWNDSRLPKILITPFFDHSFSHHCSHVISVGRYLGWWKLCRKKCFFWSEQRIQLEKPGRLWWSPPPCCCAEVAAEWSVGYQLLHQLLPQQRV